MHVHTHLFIKVYICTCISFFNIANPWICAFTSSSTFGLQGFYLTSIVYILFPFFSHKESRFFRTQDMIDVEIHILTHLLYAIEHIQQSHNNILNAITTNVVTKNIFNFFACDLCFLPFLQVTLHFEYIVMMCYSLTVKFSFILSSLSNYVFHYCLLFCVDVS